MCTYDAPTMILVLLTIGFNEYGVRNWKEQSISGAVSYIIHMSNYPRIAISACLMNNYLIKVSFLKRIFVNNCNHLWALYKDKIVVGSSKPQANIHYSMLHIQNFSHISKRWNKAGVFYRSFDKFYPENEYDIYSYIPSITKEWSRIYIYIYIYSANKIFAVLRRNRSDPLSRAMGCIGELRTDSRSAGYERFGTGNLAPLAVLVPIPKPATHSKGASNQHPHCTVYIWMYHVGSHWIAVKICTGQQVNSQTPLS